MSRTADGRVVGEGAAAVVLKRLADALRDGDRIHAVIRGIGSAVGGGVDRLPTTSAWITSLHRAATDVGLSPGTVGYLETHGSGHPGEDGVEIAALQQLGQTNSNGPELRPRQRQGGRRPRRCGSPAWQGWSRRACASIRKCCRRSVPEALSVRSWRPKRGSTCRGDRNSGCGNLADAPRQAAVSGMSVTGQCLQVVLEEGPAEQRSFNSADRIQPLGARREALFVIEADDGAGLRHELERLRTFAAQTAEADIEKLARSWWEQRSRGTAPAGPGARRRAATASCGSCRAIALRRLTDPSPRPLSSSERRFLRAGTHRSGRGRCLRVSRFRQSLRRHGPRAVGPVARGAAPDRCGEPVAEQADVARAVLEPRITRRGRPTRSHSRAGDAGRPRQRHGASVRRPAGGGDRLQPRRVGGRCSPCGPGADRDEMLRRVYASPLFTDDLAGPCDAARARGAAAEGEAVDWQVGVAAAPASVVRQPSGTQAASTC